MPGQRHEPEILIETGDIEIGAVELKDATADTRASIAAANTARTTATIVIATQAIDAAGAVLKTSAIENSVSAIPAKGTAAMVGSTPVTIATNDTQFGAVDAAADVDGGGVHAQLRYIGEAVDNLPTAVGSAAMASSMPVTIATDDTSLAWGTLTRTAINFTAGGAGTTAIVAAGTNCLYIVACVIMTDTQVGMTLVSTTATPVALTGIMPVAQRGGFVLPPWPGIGGGWLKSVTGQNLGITVSAACDIDGFIITRDAV